MIYGYGISGKSISKYLKRKNHLIKFMMTFLIYHQLKINQLTELEKLLNFLIILLFLIKINKNHILYLLKKDTYDLDFYL